MSKLQTIFVFLTPALVVAITPGPGILYIAARTLAGGRTEGLASSIGLGLGGCVMFSPAPPASPPSSWRAPKRS